MKPAPKTTLILGAAVLAATLAVPGQAQEFTFGTNKIIASPGQTIEIPVYLKGVPVPVAGANLTVRMEQADLWAIHLDRATAFSPVAEGNPNFEFAYNNRLLRSSDDVNNGEIRGDVLEFRGVLYSASGTPATFDAMSPKKVASIFAEVAPNARGRYELELVSAIDNMIGLLGVSNAAGETVVPGGADRPAGDMLLVVIKDGLAPVEVDFTDAEHRDGWIYDGQLPAEESQQPTGSVSDVNGLEIQSVADNSYGFWGYDRLNKGAWRNPDPDVLWVIDWKTKSDANGFACPVPRLRVMTNNDFASNEMVLQDLAFNGSDGISLVPGTAGRTVRTIAPTPAYAADGISWDGMNLFYDMVQFGIGEVGKSLYLPGVNEYYVKPSALTGARVVFEDRFDEENAGPFVQAGPDLGGRTVTYVSDRDGLGVTSGGSLDTSTGDFSFGIWFTPAGTLPVTMNSNKWYKVEAQVIGTAFRPAFNPNARLRVYPDNGELQVMAMINPFVFPEDQTLPRPSRTARPVTCWFQPPVELNGKNMNVAFELIHLVAPLDGTDATPTLSMKELKITEYDAPTL